MLSFVDVSVNVYLKICPSRGWPPVGLKRNKGLLALAEHIHGLFIDEYRGIPIRK